MTNYAKRLKALKKIGLLNKNYAGIKRILHQNLRRKQGKNGKSVK
jgi:hypothetical protein